MGDLQLNKKFGRITMAQHGGPETDDHMPSIVDTGGTPNQKVERAAILLRAAFLDRNPSATAVAIRACLQLLDYQRQHGHQRLADANEWLTNSHAPIWYRGMGSMTATARDLRESPVAGVDPALVQQINAAVDYWWSCQFSACKAVRVPSGPKAGSVVTLGARFRAGGDDQVRDIVIGLLDGESPGHLAGRKFWINALAYQDTFGAELVRRLVTAGRLHPVIVAQVPTAGTFAIDYFEDGHTTFAGNLQSGDPGALSVCYSTGDVITGAGGEQLGARKRSLSIGRVAA